MLDRGYLRIARPSGIEVRIHWSVVLGALLSARLRLEPLAWLGYLSVLLAHQLGHAAAVKAAGGTLVGLDSTALGGSCRWRGSGSLLERSWVAWGGVLGQCVLLIVALSLAAFGAFSGRLGAQLGYCFVEVNLALVAVNLLPFAPMDGALAWRLFGQLKASEWTLRQALLGWVWRWARRRRERRQDGPGTLPAGEASNAQLTSTALAPGVSAPAPEAQLNRARSKGASDSVNYGPTTSDDRHEVEEEPVTSPRPSEQAQREIDALLRRVEDRAAQSRRGR